MAVLTHLVIATTGTLPHDTKQVKNWIERNGGRYATSVGKEATHLIASKESYKKTTSAVAQASALGIPIVSFDWLDDTLQSRRKLGTKRYTWDVIQGERRKSKELKRLGERADKKVFGEGVEKARELTGTGTSKTAGGTGGANKGGMGKGKGKRRGLFFGDGIGEERGRGGALNTPFISAKEDLMRRREREEGEAERAALLKSSVASPTPAPSSSALTSTSAPSSSPLSCPSSPENFPPLSSMPARHPPTPHPTSTSLSEAPAKPHFKDSYHYYRDATGYDYKITLVRSDITATRAGYAQYHLALLESHVKPSVYWCIAQYKGSTNAASSKEEGGKANENANDDNDDEEKDVNKKEKKNDDGEARQDEKRQTSTMTNDPRAAQLHSLITPPATPSAHTAQPHSIPLTPPGTPFAPAFTAFRHAFRDLTHLAWEDRFDTASRSLQLQRARQLGLDPFIWGKPRAGMPVGLLAQADVSGDGERGGYVRGASRLPGIHVKLRGPAAFGAPRWGGAEERGERLGVCGHGLGERDGRVRGLGAARRAVAGAGDGRDGRGFVDPEFAHLLPKARRSRSFFGAENE